MANVGDRATSAADTYLNAALAGKRAEIAANSAKDSADECVECGELIPSERQIAIPGVDLCVRCAGLQERRDELRAG